MANIRISALEIEVDNKVLQEYDRYLEQVDSDAKNASKLESIFTKLYGAKRVGGNKPLVPDYTVSPGSIISGLAPIFVKERSGSINIETKFSRRASESETSTTIGGRTIGSVARQLNKSLGTRYSKNDLYFYIKDRIDNNVGTAGGEDLFNFLAKNAPKFHNEAYNKAKNLTIFSKTSSGSVLAYQIYFPRSSFKSDKFRVGYEANNEKKTFGFSYYLTNSFERNLKELVQDNITKVSLDTFKDYDFDKYKKTTKDIKFGRKASESIDIYWAHSNSIPVANIKTTIPKKELSNLSQPSIIDITMLVRGRAKLRMRRGNGVASPPKLRERTGTFRTSIEAVANMRTNTINYFYLPYYDSLERHGYQVTELVEGSIRAIAKERFGQQFILRKNTQQII